MLNKVRNFLATGEAVEYKSRRIDISEFKAAIEKVTTDIMNGTFQPVEPNCDATVELRQNVTGVNNTITQPVITQPLIDINALNNLPPLTEDMI